MERLRRFGLRCPVVVLLVLPEAVLAGPRDFGMAEFNRAVTARKLPAISLRADVVPGQPESYTIQAGRVTGGDERGLMYGLLEAAELIRARGTLVEAKGAPRNRMRGIRYFIHNKEMEKDWYYSHDYWDQYFSMLARNRFNRFNLVFASQVNYLAPPYPFWLDIPTFPEIRVPGLTPKERTRNLEALQYISQSAADHGVEFTLGVWEHNIMPGMTPTVEGLTRQNIGPYSYAALKKILELCPAIRSVQMRTNIESGIPADQQLEFYRDYVFRAIKDAGRPVTLDLRAWILAGGMIDAAMQVGVPTRVSAKYWAEDMGRPYPPAETYPNYSYMNLLEWPSGVRRRPYEFYWEMWTLGSHRLLLWGDPGYVRRAASTFDMSGSIGFEIDAPLAQKGFGNRPEKWGVFAEAQQQRVFWKYEFERYWMFYQLWGRLSYDPKTPDSFWQTELRQRLGSASEAAGEAYRLASQVICEVVAVHLADPNMYIWPEINPGGLIESYREVRPSDWSHVAWIPEAVRNRIKGVASAKQTPRETSARLDSFADGIDRAVAQVRRRLGNNHSNKEWESTEPDFQVLALLSRYHARKQVAADQLTYFYETGDPSALESAKRELTKGLAVWTELAHLTDGLYPEEMSFGPDDVGHWKDKLPYVKYDLELVREREELFKRFGRFEFGFDFGTPAPEPRGLFYRTDPYVRRNNVEPRFVLVPPDTRYEDSTGYGWMESGPRKAVGMPLTPYHEVRGVAKQPAHLPHDVLFSDYIQGQGPQRFRVKAAPGEYTVLFLHPDHTTTTTRLSAGGGFLTIQFPQGEWSVSGLVIQRPGSIASARPQKLPKHLPRPSITHTGPSIAEPGKPLVLRLDISPLNNIAEVRLHYRPVNQLAEFKVITANPAGLEFTIPASDISPNWDLMYYFEVLNTELGGWFQPDPLVATPYYVVETQK